MADPWRTLGSGDRVPLSAANWNAMMRAAKANRDRELDRLSEAIRSFPSTSIVPVRNTGDSAVERFGVLGIDGPAIERNPSGAPNEAFFERIVLDGSTPTADHYGAFAVLLEPAPAGEIARGVVSGVTLCKVEMPEEGLTFAELNVGGDAPLVAQGYGPAQLLWVEPEADRETEGVAWCVVRIGSDTRGVKFGVKVTIDGGSAGSDSATCSFTYTVKTMAGVTIGAARSPKKRRYANVPYSTTPADSEGVAFYDASNVLQLFDANELDETEDCA